MPDQRSRKGSLPWQLVCAAVALIVLAGLGIGGAYWFGLFRSEAPPPARLPPSTGDVTAQVHTFCGACHAYPPPDSFPRSAWKQEVERGYQFFGQAGMALQPPPLDDVIRYYEERAPEELPKARPRAALGQPSVRFAPARVPGPPGLDRPAISNVKVACLSDDRLPDILATDMRSGRVMALRPRDPEPRWRVLATLANPCHVEVVDLDGDGIKDLLVADLGSFMPTDQRCGRVVWLRGDKDGGFTPTTLLSDVGRVADVRAGDFRGIGKLDLVVASFGWNNIGQILYLENQTSDWSRPKFVPRVLDERHGAIHVPVADINGDGKLDFVAVIAQEHEAVVAFLGEGDGTFRKQLLYAGPHPAYGSSGIQLVDLNGDGHLDVLYTNGDVLDSPYLLKPYHSVQWLENPGRGTAAWKHHPITPFYGVHRAVAADFTGAGRKDIVAVSFLPVESFPQRARLGLESILFLERDAAGRFAAHPLETSSCDHVTCAAGDLYGTGRADFVTGNFISTPSDHVITIWKNQGPGGKGQ
jgi:FG-GAP-like repeat